MQHTARVASCGNNASKRELPGKDANVSALVRLSAVWHRESWQRLVDWQCHRFARSGEYAAHSEDERFFANALNAYRYLAVLEKEHVGR